MNYKSTRDSNNIVTPSQAILQGLATDGGLYVPTTMPEFDLNWDKLSQYSYQDMASYILKPFLSDFSKEQLEECIRQAYDDKFDTETIAPIHKVGDTYYLELFHGSTIAFKDMALSILPYLMKKAAEINGNTNEIIILTATSGDTGKAAMAGFSDVEGTKIIVFYPKGGVSSIQEQQMITQTGDNTFVASIIGNFDDAQTEVKNLFNDLELRQELLDKGSQFSSANSMNIGRLIPQIVYYFYAYSLLVKNEHITAGDPVDFSVPTGNFGNILAAFYAKQCGLPINKLICASNDNKVLFDFFNNGQYDRLRDFILTISPSMDILVSSNLERLIYHAVNEDSERLTYLMNQLSNKGQYQLTEAEQAYFSDFLSEYVTEDETKQEIAQIFEESAYIIDPHTAVGSKAWRKLNDNGMVNQPVVIVSTASPYKFPEAVLNALNVNTDLMNDEDLLTTLHEQSKVPYPPAVDGLLKEEKIHDTTLKVNQMRQYVQQTSSK
ncbi:threonine synthase [Aerococcaceae bacterium WGS1372]